MADLRELDKLEVYLKEHGYFYERIDKECRYDDLGSEVLKGFNDDLVAKFGHPFDQHQIVVYNCDVAGMTEEQKQEHYLWDAICHWGSYGYEKGLLEVMGPPVAEVDVEGYLTAQDIIDILEEEEAT